MAEPSYYLEGNASRRQDTQLRVRTKQLGVVQSSAGADPAFNPRRTDSLRIVRQKLLKAIRSTL